jgi:hypothetical protein
MSWNKIMEQPEFRNRYLHKRTLQRNYRMLMKNNENCYVTGRKDNPGWRPKRVSREALAEATNLIDAGELENGEDVRRTLMPDVPARTVRETLSRDAGYPGFAQIKKPDLLPQHISQREAMWNAFRNWEDPTAFARGMMIFSDEKKFILHGSDGKRYCRRPRGQTALADRNVQRRVPHGRGKGKDKGKLNVWGCIHLLGTGPLVRVEGLMDSKQYTEILSRGLLPTILRLPLLQHHSFFYFQQDNDSKHNSHRTRDWLRDQNINKFPWPARSPDLSPIENCWAELDRVRISPEYGNIQTSDQLFNALTAIWGSEDFQEYTRKVYMSFPRRLVALRENNFSWVDY